MPCSHCSQNGHTYLKCPMLTPEQIEEKKEAQKKIKEDKEKKKKLRERYDEIHVNREYTFVNNNMYEVVLYWGFSNIPENENKQKDHLIRSLYIPAMESVTIKLCKLYRIAIFPFLEVPSENTPTNAQKIILINEEYDSLFKLLDIELVNYPDTKWEFSRNYNPPKSEIEQWKEFGLKSHYLLKEIEKITGGGLCERYENLEPIMDMIQDIQIPQNCTEHDKEMAGIPSALTNIS